MAHSVILSGVHDAFYLLPPSLLRDGLLEKVCGGGGSQTALLYLFVCMFFQVFCALNFFSPGKKFERSMHEFFLSYLRCMNFFFAQFSLA